jgi:putative redox protein
MPVISVSVQQTGTISSEAHIRQHSVAVDRPVAKGGSDSGPMGGELLLAALGGCFMSTLLAAVEAREAQISQVEIAVDGTLEGNPAHFTAIEMSIRADYPDAEQMAKLVTIAERSCIVANTLKGAVDILIRVAPREPARA